MKNIFFAVGLLLITNILKGQNVNAFNKVYSIFQAKCINCHSNAQKLGGLDLEGFGNDKPNEVYKNLFNVTPTNSTAASKGYKRVYAGRADLSFIFHKINNGFDNYYPAISTAEGSSMPKSGTELTKTEKEIIRQWILFGATKTAVIPEGRIRAYYDTTGRGLAAFDTPPSAPAAQEGFQIKMGPFFLAPQGSAGDEVEYYQKWELSLAQNVEVNRIDHLISTSSHHLIIYNFNNPSNATNIPAGLRLDANHSNISLVSAVQEKTDLRLPNRTAYKWPKDRVLDLNSHYINYSANHVYKAEAYINVYTQPTGTAKQEMFATLVPNTNISIPNNNQTTTIESPFFYFGKVYVWGLMGHTHKFGTGYKVFKRLPNGAKGELMYDASCPSGVPGCSSPFFDYQHIPMRYFQPLTPVDLSIGFIHQASWRNNGDRVLTFGPTSDDEMMVMIALYTTDTVGLSSVKNINQLDGVMIYPNPVREKIELKLPPSVSRIKVSIFDVLGRVALNKQIDVIGQKAEISIHSETNLKRGIYIIKIEDQIGHSTVSKIILE